MRTLFMLLLGYTAYRMAVRIREENSTHLLLADQRPEMPQAPRPARSRRSRNTSSSTSKARTSASRRGKRS